MPLAAHMFQKSHITIQDILGASRFLAPTSLQGHIRSTSKLLWENQVSRDIESKNRDLKLVFISISNTDSLAIVCLIKCGHAG